MATRNVFFFFELLFWPIVGVVSIGLMTRFLELRQDATAFVLLGTIALSVVQVCQLEVAYAVLFDVWSKSIKHQFLAPIGLRHLTLGSWIVGMGRGVVIFLILAVLGWWAFGVNVLAPGAGGLLAFLAGCFLTARSEEHTSELPSRSDLVCRLLLGKKKKMEKAMLSM